MNHETDGSEPVLDARRLRGNRVPLGEIEEPPAELTVDLPHESMIGGAGRVEILQCWQCQMPA